MLLSGKVITTSCCAAWSASMLLLRMVPKETWSRGLAPPWGHPLLVPPVPQAPQWGGPWVPPWVLGGCSGP